MIKRKVDGCRRKERGGRDLGKEEMTAGCFLSTVIKLGILTFRQLVAPIT